MIITKRRTLHLTVFAAAVFSGATQIHADKYIDEVLADNPIGYWRFEEGSGTAVDLATSGNSSNGQGSQDGTYLDGVTTIEGPIRSEDPAFPEFNEGSPTSNIAANFNSNDGYIRVDDPFGLLGTPVGENPWTYEFWWLNQTPGPGGANRPVSKGINPSTTNFNRVSPSSEWSISSGAQRVRFDDPIQGVWTHVVGVIHSQNYDPFAFNSDLRVYVNGELVADARVPGQPDDNVDQFAEPLSIGAWLTPAGEGGGLGVDNFFTGAVDELAVYNYALDDPGQNGSRDNTRIMAHFLAANATPPPPIGTWVSSGSGDWHNDLNWVGKQIPSGNDGAIFDRFIKAPRTIFTEIPISLNSLTFNNENEYVIMGNGDLTMTSNSGPATIDLQSGNHTFQLPVTLAAPTTVTTANGTTLTFKDQVDLDGNDLTETGDGMLVFDSLVLTGGGTIAINGATLSGSGHIDGSVTNSAGGTVAPGNSPGTLTIAGDYTQEDSRLSIDIAGLASGAQHDLLTVGGTATLQGELEISLLDGYVPSLGDSFDILTALNIVDNGLILSGASEGFSLSLLVDPLGGDVLRLTRSAVPEPATGILAGIAAIWLLGLRKRPARVVADTRPRTHKLASAAPFAIITAGMVGLVTPDHLWAQIPTTGLKLHYDATDASSIEDENGASPGDAGFTGKVVRWKDKATVDGANDATQDNLLNAPEYLPPGDPTSPPSGLPVVDLVFDEKQWMDIAPVSFSAAGGGSNGMTVFLVVRADYDPTGAGAGAFGNWEMWLSSKDDGNTFITTRASDGLKPGENAGPWMGYTEPIVTFGNNGETRNAESRPEAVQAWHLITAGFDENGSRALINGDFTGDHCQQGPGVGPHTERQPCNTDPPDPGAFIKDVTWDLLGDYGGIRGFTIADGEIGEIAMYDRWFDPVERSEIEVMLGDKWGFRVFEPAPVGTWTSTFSGLWHTAENWSESQIPGVDTDLAVFIDRIEQPGSIVVETDVTVGSIMFENVHEYAIGGNGAVILDSDSGTATIDVNLGSHKFQGEVTLVDPTTVTAADGAMLTFATLNLGGNILTKEGDGRVNVNANQNTGGGSVVLNGGSIGGNGEIGGSLTANAGTTVAPGNSAGTLSVETDFTLDVGAMLEIEIGGTTKGEDYDVLSVAQNLDAGGGTLKVILDSFTPAENDQFDILDFGSISNDFALDLPAGVDWNTSQLLTAGILSVGGVIVEPLLGDYDDSGEVGTGDLNLVLFNWNEPGSGLPSQWVNQRPAGIVGVEQLNGVLFNWANTASASTVPEPVSASVMLTVAFCGMVVARRVHGTNRS